MVVVMKERVSSEQVEKVIAHLVELGMDVHRSTGASRVVLGVVGSGKVDPRLIEMMDGVHEVLRITEPYKLASRTFKPEDTVFTVGDVRIGGDEVIVMAGPCSAENEAQVNATAAAVKRAGAKVLRGGAFKPRSSPYSFQGLGEGLRLLQAAANTHDLKLVTEVMDISQIEVIGRYADMFQVGARNLCRTSRCSGSSAAPASPCCSSAAFRRRSRWLLSADKSSPAATPRSSSASAASGRSRPPPQHAGHLRHRSSSSSVTCPSSSIRATARAGGTKVSADGPGGGGRQSRRPADRGPATPITR